MKHLLSFFALLSIIFCSCQTSAPLKKSDGQTVRININSEPSTLDPRKVRDLTGINVTRMLFDGLCRISKEEKVELSLADEVSISEGRKKYRFHLRPAFWSNGDPIVAEDFVYAWKKSLDPAFSSDYAFQLYVLKNAKGAKEGKVSLDAVGVRALDRFTLQVELEQPLPNFLELVTLPIFFPVNARMDRENPHWAENSKGFIGNGPFLLKEWAHQSALHFEKNPHYWDQKAVSLSQLEFVMVQEETEFKLFEQNALHWAGSPLSVLPLDALSQLIKENRLKKKPLLATYFLRTNTAKFPFEMVNMRKAFSYAIDRKEIVQHVTHGTQLPAKGLVPPCLALEAEWDYPDGDRQSAKELFLQALEERAMDFEKFPALSLLYPSSERNHLIAQVLQEEWRAAFGIRVALEAVERKVFFERIAARDFDIAIGSWVADFNDPVSFLEPFKTKQSRTNQTSWESADYAFFLEKAISTVDPHKRKQLLKKCEERIISEMPIIPIFHYTMLYLQDERLTDVVLTPLGGIDFKWAKMENGERGDPR